jgi:hypothetical protein
MVQKRDRALNLSLFQCFCTTVAPPPSYKVCRPKFLELPGHFVNSPLITIVQIICLRVVLIFLQAIFLFYSSLSSKVQSLL